MEGLLRRFIAQVYALKCYVLGFEGVKALDLNLRGPGSTALYDQRGQTR